MTVTCTNPSAGSRCLTRTLQVALAALATGACLVAGAAPALATSGAIVDWDIVHGPGDDGYECMAATPAGVAAAGFAGGVTRDVLIRFGSGTNRTLGRLIWANPGHDQLVTAMAVDRTGAAVAAGLTIDEVDADGMVVKARPNGALAWASTLDFAGGDDAFYDVACDAAGDVYAVGYRSAGENADMWVVKLAGTSGELLWQVAYDNGGQELGTALCLDAQGNAYATGESGNTAAQQATRGDSDVVTVKYDGSGAQMWVARNDGGLHGADRPDDIALGTSGALFVSGAASAAEPGRADFLLARMKTDGTQVWQRTLDDRSHWEDVAYALRVSRDNSAYLAGAAGAPGRNSSRAVVARWSSSGRLLWKREWAAPGGRAVFNDMVINAAGTVWCAGSTTRSHHTRDLEGVVCKYDADGRRLWSTIWEGPGRLDDRFSSLALQGSAAVFAAGMTESADLDYDAVTVKFRR